MALRVVEGGSESPPYPEDIKARGWEFHLDIERLRASDTWTLAAPDQRPWLLMLWVSAWDAIPIATLPADDAVIAARIGLQIHTFLAWREVLMRGWWRASDGRYYHRTLTERVLDMIERREKDTKRVANWRSRNGLVTRNQHVVTSPSPSPSPLKSKPLAARPKSNGRLAGEVVLTIPSNKGEEIAIHKGFVDELELAYPDVDPLATLRECRAWCVANPRKCKTEDGIPRFINSWFARVQNG